MAVAAPSGLLTVRLSKKYGLELHAVTCTVSARSSSDNLLSSDDKEERQKCAIKACHDGIARVLIVSANDKYHIKGYYYCSF